MSSILRSQSGAVKLLSRVGLLGTALGLVLTGCGDDDDDEPLTSGTQAVCAKVGTSSEIGFNLAVASNFFDAAQAVATNYVNSIGNQYAVNVCHNATGALNNEITSTNRRYFAAFLAADGRTDGLEGTDYVPRDAESFYYARGIIAFYVSPDAYANGENPAREFLEPVSDGASADPAVMGDTDVVVRKVPETPAVEHLSIGNPDSAPYGVVALNDVLRAMSLDNQGRFDAEDVVTAQNGSCSASAGSNWICEYNNISLAKQAIDNDEVTAGFISYGQVCPDLGSTVPVDQYVRFPDYPVWQKGILLDTDNDPARTSTQERRAGDFIAFMLGGAGSPTWNDWLQGNCYGPIPE